jgi:hypothetical protein
MAVMGHTSMDGMAMNTDMDTDMNIDMNTYMNSTMNSTANDGIPMAVHHVNAYQGFSNALISILLCVATLAYVSVALFYNRAKIVLGLVFISSFLKERWRKRFRIVSFVVRKITGWLSLFENSPSFA